MLFKPFLGKEPACQCRRCKRLEFNLWVRKIPWRRAWQPSPVFLPGESRGQRSLVGCSPWGHKESDMAKQHSTTEQKHNTINNFLGLPGGNSGKEPFCQCRRQKKCGFGPWVGKIPWRRAEQTTPVFLPGGRIHKEADMTEVI